MVSFLGESYTISICYLFIIDREQSSEDVRYAFTVAMEKKKLKYFNMALEKLK